MSIQRLPVRRARPCALPVQCADLYESIMSLNLTAADSETVLTVSGEVDMSNAHLIGELAESALGNRPIRLVLDLSGVTFFGAHGISALLRIHAAVVLAGGRCTLRQPSTFVHYLLAVTGADRDLVLEPAAPPRPEPTSGG
ncbi:STAS domain-containing protein [Plantactinospora siamensis]|uniref:STAS domain-containing protein n=1 Tax=Plantactinospora siamensis TaxID=555372 RepID=A0ABV6P6J3_9ACTN